MVEQIYQVATAPAPHWFVAVAFVFFIIVTVVGVPSLLYLVWSLLWNR